MSPGVREFHVKQHLAKRALVVSAFMSVSWLGTPIPFYVAAVGAICGAVHFLLTLLSWRIGKTWPGVLIAIIFPALTLIAVLAWGGRHASGSTPWHPPQMLSLFIGTYAALMLAARRWINPIDPAKFSPPFLLAPLPQPEPIKFGAWAQAPAGRDLY